MSIMQLRLGDAEDLGQRKRTRRELLLEEMEQVVPWKALPALIEPHYPKLGRPGRQPYPLATMLRIHFLQQWYALSDPVMEEALYDTPVMRRLATGRFVGALQGQCAGQRRVPVPGDQAAVWLHQGALPRAGEEHGAGADTVRVVESVVGAAAVAAPHGVTTPAQRKTCPNAPEAAPKYL